MRRRLKELIKKLDRKKKRLYDFPDVFSYTLIFFLDYLLYFRYLLINYRHLTELKRVKIFHNSEKGKNAFVFANGPSLLKLDFDKIKYYQKELGFRVIGVNSFILNGKIIPDYYVLSDPAFFGNYYNITEEKIKEINMVLKLLEKYKVTLFVPLEFKNKIRICTEIYYFNDYELRWFNKNVIDITKPRSYLSMTAYKALAIACYMGFEKIYIAGFDNNWFKTLTVDEENRIYYFNEHGIRQSDSGKHYVRDDEGSNLGEVLFSHSYLFTDLHKFPKNIINLDKSSLVDAFSKSHDLDIYR